MRRRKNDRPTRRRTRITMLTAFTLSILLAQAAAAPAEAAVSENDTYSWCVATGAAKTGKVLFYSDVFEGRADANDQGAYQEYVDRAYSRTKKTSGYVTSCQTLHGEAAADASLRQAAGVVSKGSRS
jgi:hypothetical protein